MHQFIQKAAASLSSYSTLCENNHVPVYSDQIFTFCLFSEETVTLNDTEKKSMSVVVVVFCE